MPELGAATQQALRELVGPNVGVSNPVDLGAGATPKLFADALTAVLNETQIDCVLVILTPVATADSNNVAREIARVETGRHPLVFVHLGSDKAPPALREARSRSRAIRFPSERCAPSAASPSTRPGGPDPSVECRSSRALTPEALARSSRPTCASSPRADGCAPI
jgi:hypothetical protein